MERCEILSPSALTTYEKCPKQLFYKKQKVQTEVSTNNQIGIVFHAAMEVYISHQYKLSWVDALDMALVQIHYGNQAIIDTVRTMGYEWLRKNLMPPVIDTELGRFPVAEFMFGPKGSKMGRKEIPDNNSIGFAELKVRGYIDMVHLECTLNGDWYVVVTDWKTSWIKPESVENDRQAHVYALVASRLSGLPVRVDFVYVRYPKATPVSWYPKQADLERVEKGLGLLQQRIKLDVEAIGVPGDACIWCDFQYTCPTFKVWTTKPKAPYVPMYHQRGLDDLCAEFAEVRSKVDALEEQRKDLAAAILNRFEDNNIIEFNGFKLRSGGRTEWSQHAKDVIRSNGGIDNMPQWLMDELTDNYRNYTTTGPWIAPPRTK